VFFTLREGAWSFFHRGKGGGFQAQVPARPKGSHGMKKGLLSENTERQNKPSMEEGYWACPGT